MDSESRRGRKCEAIAILAYTHLCLIPTILLSSSSSVKRSKLELMEILNLIGGT